MRTFKVPALAELAKLHARNPTDDRRKEMTAQVRKLLAEISPPKQYPFQYIQFRITGVRNDLYANLMISGADLANDLRVMIDLLSLGAGQGEHLFDKAKNAVQANEPLGRGDSFGGILLGATACDGHIADEEVQSLCTSMARMNLYRGWTADKFRRTVDRLLTILKQHGVDTLLDRCAQALPEDLRETAFCVACDIVLADGVVEPEEKKFLESLCQRLAIPGENAQKIVKVMVIRNRG